MPPTIRPTAVADSAACGRIIHDAFAAIADQHNFPHDFPSIEAVTKLAEMLIAHPAFMGSLPSETAKSSAVIFSTSARRSPGSGRSRSIRHSRTPGLGDG